MNNNMIVQYVRGKNGFSGNTLTGVVVARKSEDSKGYEIGWSAYNAKSENRPFTKKRALEIAVGRVNIGSDKDAPQRVMDVIEAVDKRAKKYFNNDKPKNK